LDHLQGYAKQFNDMKLIMLEKEIVSEAEGRKIDEMIEKGLVGNKELHGLYPKMP